MGAVTGSCGSSNMSNENDDRCKISEDDRGRKSGSENDE